MVPAEGGKRQWLRPAGLFLVAMILAIGQPIVLMIVTFAALAYLTPGGRFGTLLTAALAMWLVFSGGTGQGLWYLDRAWAILLGGWFVAVTMAWPSGNFTERALSSLLGSFVSAGLLFVLLDGWEVASLLVRERIQVGVGDMLDLVGTMNEGNVGTAVVQAVTTVSEVQEVAFPALLGLSSVAALGVAWWLHVRVSTGTHAGLGSLAQFRFPDVLIWLFIAGLGLVLIAEWTVGWGRLGTNLVTFMGALYILRGAGVLLFLTGGMSFLGGALVVLGVLLAGPILLTAAMAVGVGDSWLDLRERVRRDESGGAGP